MSDLRLYQMIVPEGRRGVGGVYLLKWLMSGGRNVSSETLVNGSMWQGRLSICLPVGWQGPLRSGGYSFVTAWQPPAAQQAMGALHLVSLWGCLGLAWCWVKCPPLLFSASRHLPEASITAFPSGAWVTDRLSSGALINPALAASHWEHLWPAIKQAFGALRHPVILLSEQYFPSPGLQLDGLGP